MTRLGKLRVLAAIVFAASAGIASASALVPDAGPELGGPDTLQPDGGPTTVAATRQDPGGGLDWAVRVYRSKTGQTCPEVGRLSGGRFGESAGAGRFTPVPVTASGSCGDVERNVAAFAVNTYAASSAQGARVAIFGVVAPSVDSVTLRSPDGAQLLALDRGAFLVVRAETDLSGSTLDIAAAGGKRSSYPLDRGSG